MRCEAVKASTKAAVQPVGHVTQVIGAVVDV